ncbi:MAG: Uma2 family endonuclease [Phormidesmis sp. CAN_BIN44]|nr:Uma2 family endonuclease [Phormidesmis sp. CAN_BIN44]
MNPPTVLHYCIAKFSEKVLDQAIEDYSDPDEWETFRDAGQRTEDDSSRLPDLAIVSRVEADKLLKQTAVFQSPGLLAVEVVSPSSASEDYDEKLKEHQALGIPEYWVVDYEGLAAKHIGFPKVPTLTVHQLVDSKYRAKRFCGDDRIISPTFQNLNLTAKQVFAAGQQRRGRDTIGVVTNDLCSGTATND